MFKSVRTNHQATPASLTLSIKGEGYPLARMNKGECLFVAVKGASKPFYVREHARISAELTKHCKGGYLHKFTVYKCPQEGGIRVWRLS